MRTSGRKPRIVMIIAVAAIAMGIANGASGQANWLNNASLPQTYSGNPQPIFLKPGNDLRGSNSQSVQRMTVRLSSSGGRAIVRGESEQSALPANSPVVPPVAVLAPVPAVDGISVYDGLPAEEGDLQSHPNRSERENTIAEAAARATGRDKPATIVNATQSEPVGDEAQSNHDGEAQTGGEDSFDAEGDSSEQSEMDDAGDDEGDDEGVDCDEQLKALDRVLHSDGVQRILGLLEENLELRAQLRIQQIEFEAQQRIHELKQALESTERELQGMKQSGVPSPGPEGRRRGGPMGQQFQPRPPMEMGAGENGNEMRHMMENLERTHHILEQVRRELHESQVSNEQLKQRTVEQQAQLSELSEQLFEVEVAKVAELAAAERLSIPKPKRDAREHEATQKKHKKDRKKDQH